MAKRKRYTAEEKVKILREVLEKDLPISEVAERFGVHVNDIYNWKKKLFENASGIFDSPRTKAAETAFENRRVERLERTLKLREEAIEYLLTETVKLKKSSDGGV
jgi:transposase-like protein